MQVQELQNATRREYREIVLCMVEDQPYDHERLASALALLGVTAATLTADVALCQAHKAEAAKVEGFRADIEAAAEAGRQFDELLEKRNRLGGEWVAQLKAWDLELNRLKHASQNGKLWGEQNMQKAERFTDWQSYVKLSIDQPEPVRQHGQRMC
jgi:hypothetical protein